jgi:pimeloyl-ACP methyl ester carboxylesterase
MVAITRRFFGCRFGQLHVRVSRPEEAPGHAPLLCFHHSPQSGRVFAEILKEFGRDRFVYAPDTPGFGDSDPPSHMPEIADYALAMADLLDGLGHVPVDLLGYHTGTSIAVDLALRRPRQVRRLVLIGIPIFTADEAAAFQAQPWPTPLTADTSYVDAEWKRSMQWSGAGSSLELVARGFVDKLKAGERAFWGGRAAMRYDLAGMLPQVTQSVWAAGPRDDLWDISPRCAPLIKNGRFEPWPHCGFGVFDLDTARISAAVRKHLDH